MDHSCRVPFAAPSVGAGSGSHTHFTHGRAEVAGNLVVRQVTRSAQMASWPVGHGGLPLDGTLRQDG